MDDFYRTGMGQKFFEHTMPSLVRELKRLNDNFEKFLNTIEEDAKPGAPPEPDHIARPGRD